MLKIKIIIDSIESFLDFLQQDVQSHFLQKLLVRNAIERLVARKAFILMREEE